MEYVGLRFRCVRFGAIRHQLRYCRGFFKCPKPRVWSSIIEPGQLGL